MKLTLLLVIFLRTVYCCNFGPNCTFPCNCEGGNSDCNEDRSCKSGQCATNLPPRFDWRGPGCQIGNVARGKSTDQSGVYNGRHSGLAVDGRRFEDYEGGDKNQQCSHTSSNPTYWYVDLGSPHVVINVTVFNMYAAYTRLSNFTVHVGNNLSYSGSESYERIFKHAECGYYPGTVPQAGNATVTCGQMMIGQYVRIQIKAGGYMHLCEVVVEGYKYLNCNNGRYGPTCAEYCGECTNADPCDDITGKCPNGCKKWFIEEHCKTELKEPDSIGPIESPSQTAYSVAIKWKQYSGVPDGGEGHYNYDVVYRRNGQTIFGLERLPHVKGQEYQTANMSGLQPNTAYEFWIRPYREGWGVRDHGWDSYVSTFRTKDRETTTTPATTTPGTTTTQTTPKTTPPTTTAPTTTKQETTPKGTKQTTSRETTPTSPWRVTATTTGALRENAENTIQTAGSDFKVAFAIILTLLIVSLVANLVQFLIQRRQIVNNDPQEQQNKDTMSNQTPIYENDPGSIPDNNKSPVYEGLDERTIEMYENPQNRLYEGLKS